MASELVRAKKSLGQVTAEILTAAKDLQAITDLRDTRKSEVGALDVEIISKNAEITSLNGKIVSKTSELAIVDTRSLEAVRVLQRFDDLKIAVEQAIADGSLEVQQNVDILEGLFDKRNMAEIIANDKQESAVSATVRADGAEKRILLLEARENEMKNRIARKAIQLQEILGAIDTAIVNFRRYEERIGHLSRETGYLIKYDDPSLLLDKEDGI